MTPDTFKKITGVSKKQFESLKSENYREMHTKIKNNVVVLLSIAHVSSSSKPYVSLWSFHIRPLPRCFLGTTFFLDTDHTRHHQDIFLLFINHLSCIGAKSSRGDHVEISLIPSVGWHSIQSQIEIYIASTILTTSTFESP